MIVEHAKPQCPSQHIHDRRRVGVPGRPGTAVNAAAAISAIGDLLNNRAIASPSAIRSPRRLPVSGIANSSNGEFSSAAARSSSFEAYPQ